MILHDPDHYPEMKRIWNDELVKSWMKPFYSKFPGFAKTPEIPILEPIEMIQDRESVSLAVILEDEVKKDGFRRNYLQCINDAEHLRSVEEMLVYYATHIDNFHASPLEISKVLFDLAVMNYGPPSYGIDWDLVQEGISDFQRTELAKDPKRG